MSGWVEVEGKDYYERDSVYGPYLIDPMIREYSSTTGDQVIVQVGGNDLKRLEYRIVNFATNSFIFYGREFFLSDEEMVTVREAQLAAKAPYLNSVSTLWNDLDALRQDALETAGVTIRMPYPVPPYGSDEEIEVPITIRTIEGAEVTLSLGDIVQTATVGPSKSVQFTAISVGSYEVKITYRDEVFIGPVLNVDLNTVAIDERMPIIPISLSTPFGCTITLKQGPLTITKTSVGTNTVYLTSEGDWKLSIRGGGKTAEKILSITEGGDDTFELSFPKIYGVTWDGSATSDWTRTDDAASFEDPVPYVAGATDYGSPFDTLQPWAGMTRDERTGGSMVRIPKFWYNITPMGDGGLSIQIADGPTDGFFVSPAHADRGDGAGERDVVYIGRYHSGLDYKSKTGVTPLTNVPRASARAGIHALGETIWQIDLSLVYTLWLLYLVEYGNWNSQGIIGYGCGNNTGRENMGVSDTMPYHTGTSKSARTTYGVGVQYRNIEGLWENVFDMIDGCYQNVFGLNMILDPSKFSDSSGGILIGTPSSGFPTKFDVTTELDIPLFYPVESTPSASFEIDQMFFDSSYPIPCLGSDYSHVITRGFIGTGGCQASFSGTVNNIGCRIMELPVPATPSTPSRDETSPDTPPEDTPEETPDTP